METWLNRERVGIKWAVADKGVADKVSGLNERFKETAGDLRFCVTWRRLSTAATHLESILTADASFNQALKEKFFARRTSG